MEFVPYLMFDGKCREAMEFYAKTLGGEITMISTYGEMPPEAGMGAETKDRIMHARLAVGDQVLMASDCPPGYYQQPAGTQISIQVGAPADAERIFAALSDGGNVRMPMAETFFAARFGMVTDRYGTPWMVTCENGGA